MAQFIWITPVIFIITGFFTGIIAEKIAFKKIKSIVNKKNIPGSEVIFSSLHRMTFLWFVLAGFFGAVLTTSQLQPYVYQIAQKVLTVIFLLSVTLVCARLASGLVSAFLKRKEGLSVSLISNLVKTLVLVVGALIVLQTVGIEITPIITTLGVGGLAVGLALQDTLSNLFSGFYLIISKQIKTGDYIQLDGGKEGYITDISWRTTTIKSLANNVIVIPNSQLGSATFTNYHLPSKELTLTVNVGVSYNSDLEKVESITVDTAKEVMNKISPDIKSRQPFVLFHTFNDFSIDYTVYIPVNEFLDQRKAKHLFVKKLHKRYQEEHITIPFPIRDLNIQNN
ncbi:MAG: mechanosensitive ion channel family protein [Mastigocoleus sp.]